MQWSPKGLAGAWAARTCDYECELPDPEMRSALVELKTIGRRNKEPSLIRLVPQWKTMADLSTSISGYYQPCSAHESSLRTLAVVELPDICIEPPVAKKLFPKG